MKNQLALFTLFLIITAQVAYINSLSNNNHSNLKKNQYSDDEEQKEQITPEIPLNNENENESEQVNHKNKEVQDSEESVVEAISGNEDDDETNNTNTLADQDNETPSTDNDDEITEEENKDKDKETTKENKETKEKKKPRKESPSTPNTTSQEEEVTVSIDDLAKPESEHKDEKPKKSKQSKKQNQASKKSSNTPSRKTTTSTTTTATTPKRFVHHEEVKFEAFSQNPNSQYSEGVKDPKKYCYPIYNTSKNGTRRLTKEVHGFSLKFNIKLNYNTTSNYVGFDVNIYKGDFDSSYSLPLIDTCYNSMSYYYESRVSEIQITCTQRVFEKDYVVAICPSLNNISWQEQNSKIRASGFVLS